MNATSYAIIAAPPSFPTLPPYTAKPLSPLLPWISDFHLSLLLPVLAYWLLSGIYHFISTYDFFREYRLHTPAEFKVRNRVPVYEVLRSVILQQVVQTALGLFLGHVVFGTQEFTNGEEYDVTAWAVAVKRWEDWLVPGAKALLGFLGVDGTRLGSRIAGGGGLELPLLSFFPVAFESKIVVSWGGSSGLTDSGFTRLEMWTAWVIYRFCEPAARFAIAIFFSDSWQYFWHRAMHANKWMYRNMHAHHHRMYVPYAFGAFYNTLAESFLLDTVGTALSFAISGLSTRQAMVFATISVLKGVDDHCGYRLPWDPLQWLGEQNTEFHDVHHQSWGINSNYSQLYSTFWDHVFATVCPKSPEEIRRLYDQGRERAEKQLREQREEKEKAA